MKLQNGTYATRALNERLPIELGRLPRDIAGTIEWFLQKYEVPQKELAANLGVSEGRVSQILCGDTNLTLRSLAAVAAALDAHFEVRLVPNDPQRKAEEPSRGAGDVEAPDDLINR
ncbi:helix-turn-helix domain-containing protein [Streptomyces sp. NPDC048564]|uniref:helix-turn-helix domain-containing protein n=1 Tax=Streptomyces sp. NPDC048564 TaxID=3155760 RepID=UPI00343B0B27